MGVISEDYINFKNSSFLFSRIKRRLKNLTVVGLIDENNFPEYVADILNMLGIAVFKEEEAILTVKNKKACLPDDFKLLYAAYKCTPDKPSINKRHYQNRSVFEYDITSEIYCSGQNCNIECDYDDRVIEKLTLRQFVNEGTLETIFTRPTLLKLSPNVKSKYAEDCLNLHSTSTDEITIDNGFIYTNFDDDAKIYIKYYALPLDDEGLPMIPDIIEVEKAIEAYIIYHIFLDAWLTDDIPNALHKMQYLEKEYDEAMGNARYISKLPSFSKMVNQIKTKKGINMVAFFSQIQNR